jgi:predicted RecB family nuclease
MQLIDGTPVFSATDLVGFLECQHLTNLERAALAGLVQRPVRQNDEIELIAKRGLDHERRYLERLRADGRTVASIERDGSGTDQGAFLRAAAADTEAAMRDGAQVIYQATFFDGQWRGHADFLHRIEEPSLVGAWSYAVADTKLARKAKAGALLQMCVYSDLLTRVQGVEPPWMEVALGGSARAIDRFRVADYMAYYRRARARFEALMARSDVEYPVTATYPEPVDHCEVCRWAVMCGPERRRDDHLSLVAGISTRQRQRLAMIGVDTVAALGELPIPVRPVLDGISDQALERVREQARLQMEGRRQDKVLFELLAPIEALRGLALLPEPSSGDLFFDIEGDPFVEEEGSDGLEYLFGVVDEATGFHSFWGTDRAAEKRAFEDFIDFVMRCWEAAPNLHIYHYGAYEPSHVKKLMGLHATREDEVDRLLRGDVFVDLYRVVQQGVRVSQESYSIKKLEPLYGLTREVALRDAGSSIVNFELWLDGGRTNQPLLDLIEAYNQDDCVSNLQLRDWLEARRTGLVAQGTDGADPGATGDVAVGAAARLASARGQVDLVALLRDARDDGRGAAGGPGADRLRDLRGSRGAGQAVVRPSIPLPAAGEHRPGWE